MGDNPDRGVQAARPAFRIFLWFHAFVWVLFAGSLIALAIASPPSLGDPVFVQVAMAASAAMIGSIAAALWRPWGVALALAGGLAVIAAWIAGDSGRELRFAVALILSLFALVVMLERRALVTPAAR